LPNLTKTFSGTHGRNDGGKGGYNAPGVSSLARCRKVLTTSEVLSSINYVRSQKTMGSNMGAPNLFLAPGAI